MDGNSKGCTLLTVELHVAILASDKTRVEQLLEDGNHPNDLEFDYDPSAEGVCDLPKEVSTLRHVSPLHLAVIANDLQVMSLLLKSPKIDVNYVSGLPMALTALELASLLHRKQTVKMLIESGANFPKTGPSSDDLSEVLFKGFGRKAAAKALVDMLLAWGPNGDNFLHHYCRFKNWILTGFREQVVRNLIGIGLNVNGVNDEKETALHCFVDRNYSTGSLDGIDILFRNGANLSSGDKKGNTPLMRAIEGNASFELLTKLLDIETNVEAINSRGYNPLALFVNYYGRYGQRKTFHLLRRLLDKGSNLLHKTPNGKCLLTLSAKAFVNFEMKVDFLLENGLNPDVDVMKECFCSKRFGLVYNLLKRSQELQGQEAQEASALLSPYIDRKPLELKTYFPEALIRLAINCRRNNEMLLPLIRTLVEDFRLDPNYTSGTETLSTALIKSQSEEKVVECIDYLISLKYFDFNAVVNNGETALTVALSLGKYVVAEKLLLAFVDVTRGRLKTILPKPGTAYTLMLLYFAGFVFPSCLSQRLSIRFSEEAEEETGSGSAELTWFAGWLKQKITVVLSLQQMAGNRVRRVYGIKTKQLLRESNYPKCKPFIIN